MTNLIREISKATLICGLSTIVAASTINFLATSSSIKTNPEFDRYKYEKELDNFAASFSDEDTMKKNIGTDNTQLLFDTILFYPGKPGRYLAYWIYDK